MLTKITLNVFKSQIIQYTLFHIGVKQSLMCFAYFPCKYINVTNSFFDYCIPQYDDMTHHLHIFVRMAKTHKSQKIIKHGDIPSKKEHQILQIDLNSIIQMTHILQKYSNRQTYGIQYVFSQQSFQIKIDKSILILVIVFYPTYFRRYFLLYVF